MPPFDRDFTDPTPATVEKAMLEAVTTANGKARVGLLTADPIDYRNFLAREFAKDPDGVVLWLAEKGRVDSYPPTPRATLIGVAWRTTPLGRTVRVVGRRIEPFQENPTHRFGPPYRPWPVVCHLDPDHVVMRTFTGSAPEVIAMCDCGAVGPPEKLAWTHEGTCGPCHDYRIDHGTALAKSLGPPALRTTGHLRYVGWLPSGKALAAWEWIPTGYRQATSHIAVWDRLTGQGKSARPSTSVGNLIPPDQFGAGLALPTGSIIWVPEKGEPGLLAQGPSYSSHFALNGPKAAALRYDGFAQQRDLTSDGGWSQAWPARRNDYEAYYSIALAPDGTKAALGRRPAIEVLDWPAGTNAQTLSPNMPAGQEIDLRVHALAFSADGKCLAAAAGQSGFVEDPGEDWFGWGGSLHLYDVVKGEFLAAFPRERDDILSVAFSPDGQFLFSGATDCQIRVVEVKTRQEICVLSGHVGCVNHLAFSPDGETLASAGGDGLVRLWPWRQLIERPVGEKPPAEKRPAEKKRKGK